MAWQQPSSKPESEPEIAPTVKAMIDNDTASAALGIEVTEAGQGTAVARMKVTEQMINGHGIAHGGFIFLLADTAFACACNSYGPVTVAAGADISFVTGARLGDLLTATATERTRYGRNGIYDVTVQRQTANGTEIIAEFRGRSRVLANGLTSGAARNGQ